MIAEEKNMCLKMDRVDFSEKRKHKKLCMAYSKTQKKKTTEYIIIQSRLTILYLNEMYFNKKATLQKKIYS